MADKEKPTVAEGMKARSIFPTLAEAQQFLSAQADRFSDWPSQTFVAPAVTQDDEGNVTFDPTYYESNEREIMVATLKNKGKAGATSTMKAIVMAPLPTLETLLGVESLTDAPGVEFVREIIRKELNHRAVRPLRVVENPVPAASAMPLTVENFITSQREAGGLFESFDELYKKISDTMSDASKAWKKRKLTKSDIRHAMESKAYALDMFPELEEAGANGSLFVFALKLGVKAAERDGLDPTIFNNWLNSRDNAAYTPDDEEDEELELDSLLDDMLADEPEAEATTEPSAPSEGTTETEPAQTEPTDSTEAPTEEPTEEPTEPAA